MYTNFFTINYVEQLTFSKTFVDHLQFEQLIFFCLKVKLLEIQVRQIFFDCGPFFTFLSFARMVSSNNKIVSSRFFEQSNFEQMIMTLLKMASFKIWFSIKCLSPSISSLTFPTSIVFFSERNFN